MDLKNKRAVVMGLAKSGVAAIKFLAASGAKITATDLKSAAELSEALSAIGSLEVELVLGEHPDRIFEAADLIVVSPGVPRDFPPLLKAVAEGRMVVGEVEFAARELSAPMIAVFGLTTSPSPTYANATIRTMSPGAASRAAPPFRPIVPEPGGASIA